MKVFSEKRGRISWLEPHLTHTEREKGRESLSESCSWFMISLLQPLIASLPAPLRWVRCLFFIKNKQHELLFHCNSLEKHVYWLECIKSSDVSWSSQVNHLPEGQINLWIINLLYTRVASGNLSDPNMWIETRLEVFKYFQMPLLPFALGRKHVSNYCLSGSVYISSLKACLPPEMRVQVVLKVPESRVKFPTGSENL